MIAYALVNIEYVPSHVVELKTSLFRHKWTIITASAIRVLVKSMIIIGVMSILKLATRALAHVEHVRDARQALITRARSAQNRACAMLSRVCFLLSGARHVFYMR